MTKINEFGRIDFTPVTTDAARDTINSLLRFLVVTQARALELADEVCAAREAVVRRYQAQEQERLTHEMTQAFMRTHADPKSEDRP